MPTALGCSAHQTGPDLCSELNRPLQPEDCDKGGPGLWGPRLGHLTGQRPGTGEIVTAGVGVTASPQSLLEGRGPGLKGITHCDAGVFSPDGCSVLSGQLPTTQRRGGRPVPREAIVTARRSRGLSLTLPRTWW